MIIHSVKETRKRKEQWAIGVGGDRAMKRGGGVVKGGGQNLEKGVGNIRDLHKKGGTPLPTM